MSQGKDARDRLLRACYSFLVPIARFLLRSGVSFSEFEEISRTAFVRVAAQDYGIRGRETNTSRIAAMTGISRREVARLREFLPDYESDPRVRLSPKIDLLHRWHTDPSFLGPTGQPIPLPMTGSERSFATLVASVSSDIPPGAMRAELLRSGAAVDELGMLRPSKRHVVPETVDDKILIAVAFNLRGLAATIAHNSDPNRRRPGWIERFIGSEPLASKVVDEVRERFRARVEAFSEEIDDGFARLEQLRAGSERHDGDRRIGIGIYYTEDEESHPG